MSKKISELPQYIGTSQPTGDIPISIGGTTYKIDPSLLLQIKTIEGQTLIGSGDIDLTKSNVGLSNVDNTADANKPVSTATQTALNGKEDVANKSSSSILGASNTLYPTQKAVKAYVDSQTTPDATTTVKGKIKLAGDLAGTADAPTVPALSGKIGGSGTDNYVPRFNGTNAIENSQIFDNGTNVGIGTVTPNDALSVQSNVFTSIGIYDTYNDAQVRNWAFRNSAFGRFGFGGIGLYQSNTQNGDPAIGTAKFGVDKDGNVGIGTVSPDAKLHVEGISYFGSNIFTLNDRGIFFSGNNSFQRGIYSIASGLTLQTLGSPKVTITDGGNVGIGTTSPETSALLDLTSTTKGFLPPRMQQFERNNIHHPAIGLIIYNTSSDTLDVFTSNGWKSLLF